MWGPLGLDSWMAKRREDLESVIGPVERIIDEVRRDGDKALFSLTERFDKIRLESVRVDRKAIKAAYSEVEPSVVSALKEAKSRIERFHRLQLENVSWMKEVEPGIKLGVKVTPLQRVGCYVPGGRASYPSTALMCVVPAKVAGVGEVVCCTPPPINPLTLVAFDIAGADEVYSLGGVQAIAAMALGTKSVRKVQKIVGPGNVYVTAAKMLLRKEAEIDFPAGPSEIVIVADSTANPKFIAADILAQAEHDPRSPCALITTSEGLARKVGASLSKGLKVSNRQKILEGSLTNAGYLLVPNLEEAVRVSDLIAPEHLSIQCDRAVAVAAKVKNAGSIFVGHNTAVACGDYASGTNHVLPTAGYAAIYSGLDTMHFCKRSSVQSIDRKGLERIGAVIETLAKAEGLDAHARSVEVRRNEGRQ